MPSIRRRREKTSQIDLSCGTTLVARKFTLLGVFVDCVVPFICYRHSLFIILNSYSNRASENRYMTALICVRAFVRSFDRACVRTYVRTRIRAYVHACEWEPTLSFSTRAISDESIKCYIVTEYPWDIYKTFAAASSHFVTLLLVLSAGNLLNRPSPHRSPVKLITFTSVLYFLKARRNSASRGEGASFFFSFSLFFFLLGSMIFHTVRNLTH